MDPAGRRTCFLLAALALPLVVWGLQWHTRLAGLPAGFAWRDLPYPVVVEGITAGAPEELRFLAEGWAPGETLRLIDGDGATHDVVLERQYGAGYITVTGLSALVLWAAAAFVFAPRAGVPGARDFFWISLLYGTAVAIGGIYFAGAHAPDAALLGVAQLACLAFLPALFLRLALTFPRRHRLLERAPHLLAVLWAAAAGLLLWQTAVFVRYWREPGPERAADLLPPQTAADAALVLQAVVALGLLAAGSRRLELARQRRQVRWLLLGFAVGSAPYVFLRTLPAIFGQGGALPPHVDRVAELAIPATFLLAVVRHQLFDIDIILRRGLIYGLLAGFLVALYLAAGSAAGRLLEAYGAGYARAAAVAAGVLGGIGFAPLRRAIGRAVDRTFFKIERDLGLVLQALGRELAAASCHGEVAELLVRRLSAALHPRCAAVVLSDGDGLALAGDLGPEAAAACLAAHAGLPAAPAGPRAAPLATGSPELEDQCWPAAFAEAGFVVAMPVRGPDAPGLVLLGPRLTERRYLEDEIRFLAEGAGLAVAALRTLDLQRGLEAEAQARRRLDELNRLKAEFVARVAHDLRTPLTAISWTARNLLDGISGTLDEAQAGGVRAIERSAGHLAHVVGNLLEVSHLERQTSPPRLEDVDVAAAVAEAFAIVGPVAAGCGVRLVLAPAPALPSARGLADKLVESLVNLLENAIKHAPAGSEVTVELCAGADGRIQIAVRDRGAGLGGRSLPQLIAARPAQGPRPAASRGYGLGLPIVRTYLDLMGGELTAADHPEGGALFVCRLAAGVPVPEVER